MAAIRVTMPRAAISQPLENVRFLKKHAATIFSLAKNLYIVLKA